MPSITELNFGKPMAGRQLPNPRPKTGPLESGEARLPSSLTASIDVDARVFSGNWGFFKTLKTQTTKHLKHKEIEHEYLHHELRRPGQRILLGHDFWKAFQVERHVFDQSIQQANEGPQAIQRDAPSSHQENQVVGPRRLTPRGWLPVHTLQCSNRHKEFKDERSRFYLRRSRRNWDQST